MMHPRHILVDLPKDRHAEVYCFRLPAKAERDDVTLANGVLTVRGEKRSERDEQNKDKNWHVVERSYGSFSRAIPLPFDPDPAKVEAKFDKGILHAVPTKPTPTPAQRRRSFRVIQGTYLSDWSLFKSDWSLLGLKGPVPKPTPSAWGSIPRCLRGIRCAPGS
jgi:HSP20 family molecular chaperone IbpA